MILRFLMFFFLATNLLAADLPPSAEEIITEQLAYEYCQSLQEIMYDTNPTAVTYGRFITMLKEEGNLNPSIRSLYAIATRSKKYQNLELNYYLVSYVNQSDNSKILYHGTRSTLEVLDGGQLNAYSASQGWGVFFGECYFDSYDYATSRSEGTNRTWTKEPIGSVMVLRKQPGITFEEYPYGIMGSRRAYRLSKSNYSLTNLKDIIFLNEADLDKFIAFWAQKDAVFQNGLKQVGIYLESYFPLREERNIQDFYSFLCNQPEVFENKNFVEFIADKTWFGTRPFLIKKLEVLTPKAAPDALKTSI